MSQKLTNNARALLAANMSSGDTTLTIEAGKADTFPVATTTDWLAPLDWFRGTLQDSSGNVEIIKVGTRTAGSGVLAHLLRGQEGTTARAFVAGAVLELRVTAADIQDALDGNFSQLGVAGKITNNGVEGRTTPVGGIIMWSGAVASVPTGWQLCNGTNGTPDLRDRFIVGAGAAYAVGAAGGSANASLVAHDHAVNLTSGGQSNDHNHSVNENPHAHALPNVPSAVPGGSLNTGGTPNSQAATQTGGAVTGITLNGASSNHTHPINGNTSATGSSGINANLPPFLALAYIQCMGYA